MEQLPADLRARLLEDDAALIGRPFPLTADNARAIQANIRHLALLLRNTTITDRASRAAAFAEQLMDLNLRAHVTGPVACGKACEHCCKTYVSATVPEILSLARAVRGKEAKTARVNELAAKSRAMAQFAREIARLECPVLEDRSCSEYGVRPLVCRAVLSKSLENCLRIFYHRSPEPFAAADHSNAVRMFCMLILRTALKLADLPHQHVEMNHALSIALSVPDAEERWLGGEPLFAPVAIDQADAQPSELTRITEAMVTALRPTL